MKDKLKVPLLAEDYLILDCPACSRGVKVPTDSLGLRMGCPFCREPLEVARFEPAVKKMRGDEVEEEAPAKEPVLRQPLVFRSLRDDDIGVDENLKFVDDYERRRLPSDVPEWDDAEVLDERREREALRRDSESKDGKANSNQLLTRKEQMFRTLRICILSVSAIAVAVIGYSAVVKMTKVVTTEVKSYKELPEKVREKIELANLERANAPLSEFLTGAEERAAVAIINGFFEAKTNEDRLPYLRHPERVAPLLEEWYSKPENNEELPDGEVTHRDKIIDHGRYIIRLAIDFGSAGTRIFLVEQTRDSFKLDWETASGYQQMSLAEFRSNRPTEPVPFRVKLKPSEYYNYQFADRDRYRAVEVSYPGIRDFNFVGYIDLSQPWATSLVAQLDSGIGPSVIAHLNFPDGPVRDAEQIVISEIVKTSWLL